MDGLDDVSLVSFCSIIYAFHLKLKTRKYRLHVQLFCQMNFLNVLALINRAGGLYGRIGSLRKYDDDHNDDFKKTVGLMIKTTAQHVHHAF